MSSTLTDRYVYAVVRTLPEKQRADIERELRASIGDSVEAAVDSGRTRATAERDVITELGDPDRLAAGYADRSTVLIGPKYYFAYLRLLKVLFVIVLPIVAAVVVIVQAVTGHTIGEVIGTGWVTLITTAVHMGFWTTLVFAILERTEGRGDGRTAPIATWTLDALPEVPDVKAKYGLVEGALTVVAMGFFVGAIIWQQFSSVYTDDAGNPVPFLNPDLWSFWLPWFIALLVLEIVFAIVLSRMGGWNWSFAWVNVILNLAFAIPAVWLLLGQRVLNQEFLDRLGWPDAHTEVTYVVPGLVVLFVVFSLWDIVDGFVKARRAARKP